MNMILDEALAYQAFVAEVAKLAVEPVEDGDEVKALERLINEALGLLERFA